MESDLLFKLLNHWSAYSSQRSKGSLADFAAWMWTRECRAEISEEERLDVEKIKLKIFDVARTLEGNIGSSLKFHEFRILSEVQKSKKSNKQHIVSSLSFDHSTGFYFIKGLVKKRFLQQVKDPNDGRAKVISLTEKGKDELAKARKDFTKRFSIQSMSSDPKDRRTFFATLNSIHSIESLVKSK